MLEEESKNHNELIEWLIERVALLETPHQQVSAAPSGPDYTPLSEVPTVPRQAAALPGLSYEIDALRKRTEAQETQIAEDAQLIERLRSELDAAREEAISCALDRDRERTQANEWLVQLHDAKKELIRATSILEAIRTVTEELGFEMPEDLF